MKEARDIFNWDSNYWVTRPNRDRCSSIYFDWILSNVFIWATRMAAKWMEDCSCALLLYLTPSSACSAMLHWLSSFIKAFLMYQCWLSSKYSIKSFFQDGAPDGSYRSCNKSIPLTLQQSSLMPGRSSWSGSNVWTGTWLILSISF